MATFLVAFVVLGLVIIAMSVGVLLGRKPISGSCGGMSALGMEVACDICGGDKGKCEKETSKSGADASDLSYDATK
ncbi:(Na+)-NQR maturation NqrM [Simiduia sp. 21SJ11W-1]|uniref:(Na+)-NQR maturation NqrM n=1 Tax=Simiduia sp. 21SJ11W-1 TaxID=2909669 RepID=UPI00209E5B7F|nr:(Na+)-NQR maturation NqrM [Simiduia sp. 21SJ11W-1]UTA49404.1 (Na+)-NQR maturation NqrM [Simiduia sp. 21SJ11W-1]